MYNPHLCTVTGNYDSAFCFACYCVADYFGMITVFKMVHYYYLIELLHYIIHLLFFLSKFTQGQMKWLIIQVSPLRASPLDWVIQTPCVIDPLLRGALHFASRILPHPPRGGRSVLRHPPYRWRARFSAASSSVSNSPTFCPFTYAT